MQGKQGQEGDLVKLSISRVGTDVASLGRGRAGHSGHSGHSGHKGDPVCRTSQQPACRRLGGYVHAWHMPGEASTGAVYAGTAGPLQVLVAAVGRVGKSDRPSGGGAGATG